MVMRQPGANDGRGPVNDNPRLGADDAWGPGNDNPSLVTAPPVVPRTFLGRLRQKTSS